MKKNDEGFTLIELLIVIVILGILATVVVFAVGGITDRGQRVGLRRRQPRPSRSRLRRITLSTAPPLALRLRLNSTRCSSCGPSPAI